MGLVWMVSRGVCATGRAGEGCRRGDLRGVTSGRRAHMATAAVGLPLQRRTVADWACNGRIPGHAARACRFFGASVVRGKQDGSVIDRPTTEKGKKVDKSKKFGPIYKVMLHNDSFNRREYVVQVLLKVIDSMQVDDAVNVMQEAHESGIALVTAVVQEDAERYCQGLRNGGLIS